MDSVGNPDVKARKFNAAFETRGESFDDPGAENWFGPHNRDLYTDGNNGKNGEDNSDKPAPAPRTAGSRLAHLLQTGSANTSLMELSQD